jgi:hypothetical protein
VRQLLEALSVPGWVAEEPDVHLLPHLRRACDDPGSPWTFMGAKLQDAVYVVLSCGPGPNRGSDSCAPMRSPSLEPWRKDRHSFSNG